jgi:hypothetical protein
MNLWDFESILSKDTQTSPKGKKYYVMHFAPQFGSPIIMDDVTHDSLKHVTGLVLAENKRIEEAYKEASMRAVDEAEAARIMDEVNPLEADYRV